MEFTWDNEAGAGYISLLSAEERLFGVAETTIPLESLEEAAEIDALHDLLDFDRDGSSSASRSCPETQSATRP
jgi:hypothetical protein